MKCTKRRRVVRRALADTDGPAPSVDSDRGDVEKEPQDQAEGH
jgi:hypothetical protein